MSERHPCDNDPAPRSTPPGSLISALRERVAKAKTPLRMVAMSWEVERLLDVADAAERFLVCEYPEGTDHPADANADRLRRTLEALDD